MGVAKELFMTSGRGYLVDKSGWPVALDKLEGRAIGILIGPHCMPVLLMRTMTIVSEECRKLKAEYRDIALVFVGVDHDPKLVETVHKYGQTREIIENSDYESFEFVLNELPHDWLAVPFHDSRTRSKLIRMYRCGIFSLAFVGADGRTHFKDGLRILAKWGDEAFRLHKKRLKELQEQDTEKAAKQSLRSLLVREGRDYLISNDRRQVKVADLEGKTIGLYFSARWRSPCGGFTPFLVAAYNELKEKKDFEVVYISSDKNQVSFDRYFQAMPWLAIPYSDVKTKKELCQFFKVEVFPTLIILDTHGKTLQTKGREIVYMHGAKAYPFTQERLAILKQKEKAIRESQTLEKLLVTEACDFVTSHDDLEVKVSSLVGKTVGLYFAAHWRRLCCLFTPILISVYKQLKSQAAPFEIIFISSDWDKEAFDQYYESMPWLALPYGDERQGYLARYFDDPVLPQLIIIGPDGKTITHGGIYLIGTHKERSFPFTSAHIAELQKQIDAKIGKLPKEVTVHGHEHALILVLKPYEGPYKCVKCNKHGGYWIFHCEECGYDLHLDCAQEGNASEIESVESNSKQTQPPAMCVMEKYAENLN